MLQPSRSGPTVRQGSLSTRTRQWSLTRFVRSGRPCRARSSETQREEVGHHWNIEPGRIGCQPVEAGFLRLPRSRRTEALLPVRRVICRPGMARWQENTSLPPAKGSNGGNELLGDLTLAHISERSDSSIAPRRAVMEEHKLPASCIDGLWPDGVSGRPAADPVLVISSGYFRLAQPGIRLRPECSGCSWVRF